MKQTNLPTEAKKKNLKKIDAEPKPTLYKEAPAPGDFKQKILLLATLRLMDSGANKSTY